MEDAQVRFSEEISPKRAVSVPYFAALALWVIGALALGLWGVSNFQMTQIQLAGTIAVVVMMITPVVPFDFIFRRRNVVLKVHDDGIHFRNNVDFRMRHIPVEQVTDVEWDNKNVSESNMYRSEDWPAIYAHACFKRQGNFLGAPMIDWRKSITEGFVRVATENMVYLFGTDYPEHLANAIENVRENAIELSPSTGGEQIL